MRDAWTIPDWSDWYSLNATSNKDDRKLFCSFAYKLEKYDWLAFIYKNQFIIIASTNKSLLTLKRYN